MSQDSGCWVEGNNLVLIDILRRLPPKSLMRFKSVSKRWRWMITQDCYFIDLHFTSSNSTNTSTFVIYPTHRAAIYPTHRASVSIQISRILFSEQDLVFDDRPSELPDTTKITPSYYSSEDITLYVRSCILMLEPVGGLICFVNLDEHGSVIIYNPCTRQKTPWIKPASTRELSIDPKVQFRRKKITGLYKYMFGFGIDPATKQHKVFSAYDISVRYFPFMIVSHEFVCEVLTVGDNIWRKIDGNRVPSNIAVSSETVHVHGSIYWMCCQAGQDKNDVIMVFDLGSETFREIVIPSFILDLWRSNIQVQLVHKLVEVDGHISVSVREGDDCLNMWIYNDIGVVSGTWDKKTIQMPCLWSDIKYVDLKAISGLDMIVVKILRESAASFLPEQQREEIHYYNRKEKKYCRNRFEILLNRIASPAKSYSITPFFENLLPVKAVNHPTILPVLQEK